MEKVNAKEIHFCESHKGKDKHSIMKVFSLIGVFLLVLSPYIFKNKFEDKTSIIFLTISGIVLIIITFALFSERLELNFDRSGIYYRYFPYQLKIKFIPWSGIDNVNVIEFKPEEEGGYGFKFNYCKNKEYLGQGNHALEIITNEGNRILFSTLQPDKMREELEKIKV